MTVYKVILECCIKKDYMKNNKVYEIKYNKPIFYLHESTYLPRCLHLKIDAPAFM